VCLIATLEYGNASENIGSERLTVRRGYSPQNWLRRHEEISDTSLPSFEGLCPLALALDNGHGEALHFSHKCNKKIVGEEHG